MERARPGVGGDGAQPGTTSSPNRPLRTLPWVLRSRRAVLLTAAAFLLVLVGAFGLATVRESGDAVREQAAAQAESAAELGSRAVEAFLEGFARHARSFAGRTTLLRAVGSRDATAVRVDLRALVESDPRLSRAFVTDPEGRLWADWPEDPTVHGESFAHRDWYRGVVAAGGTYVSEVYLRAASPRILLTAVATPLVGVEGTTLGHLVFQVPIEELGAWIGKARAAGAGSMLLLDARGALVMESSPGEQEPRLLGRHPSLAAARPDPAAAWVAADPLTGEQSVLAMRSVEPFGWQVLSRRPTRDAYARVVGLTRWLWVAAALLFALLLVGGFAWITAARRHHLRLLALQEAKDQLAAALVHDFRNPLSALIGCLDLVEAELRAIPSAPPASLLSGARVAATRLVDMSSTILDVTRMEDGKLPVRPVPTDLAQLLRGRATDFRPRARTQGLAIALDVPRGTVEALVDPGVLTRVVENLLTNALKHTPRDGTITLALREPPGSDRVRMEVRDTGEGIAKEDLPRLFTKYGRVEGQRLGTPHDTGLGLVFCRMAVELHGGTIHAESEAGRGTTFVVELPRAPRTG
jgi:signal transduction histidine kinase